MTDIFHEVEEDLRREKLNQLWTRYGTVFVTVAGLAVAGTAGYVFWRQYQANEAAAAADRFAAATDRATANDIDGAISAFGAIGAEAREGYPVLAMFREAALRITRGDVQGTLALYGRIGETNADPRMKALARIRAAYLAVDVESPDIVKSRVADLAGDDSAWRHYAREIQAFADWRAGRAEEARLAYAALAADPETPEGVRERAAKLSTYLAGGGALPAPPPPASAPAAPVSPAAPAEGAPPAADTAPPPADGQDR